MMSNINLIIRNEKVNDYRTVEEMVREAFWNLYVPGCNEHFVLHNLRNSSDFIPDLDFVAEKEGQIVGQIVYSRGIIEYIQGAEKEVISFGPVSVLPAFQKQGIGTTLISHTINLAQEMGDVNEAFRHKLNEIFTRLEQEIAKHLKEAQVGGEITAQIDPKKIAVFLVSSWEGALMRMKLVRNSGPFNIFELTAFTELIGTK